MTAWLSVLVPLLVMFFALGMERVESRLRESTVRPEELEELLERPVPTRSARCSARARVGRWSCSGCGAKAPRRTRPDPEQARCLTGSSIRVEKMTIATSRRRGLTP